jgi:hypothetical protein
MKIMTQFVKEAKGIQYISGRFKMCYELYIMMVMGTFYFWYGDIHCDIMPIYKYVHSLTLQRVMILANIYEGMS